MPVRHSQISATLILTTKMAIYPKCEHLKISMICCSLLGIFPWQFMFADNKRHQNLYNVYSNLMLSYYVFFLITAYIKLFQILGGGGLKMDAISANICITLLYSITVTRQLIMKLSSGFRSIVSQIIDSEEIITSMEDNELVKIYNDCAEDTKQKTKLYLYLLFGVTMQYIVRPILVQPHEEQVGNATVVIKPLPLSSWFPFDEQVHYVPAYMWHILDGLVGASFVMYTDILMFNLITYPIGRLRMMQHRLRNFEDYKQKYKSKHQMEDDDLAAHLTFASFVGEHNEIIDYIDHFNNAMSALMLFDFLQSSLQIASILTQVLGNKITLLMVVFVGTFFVGMILRLFLYYYYANDVIVLSQGLASAIWESNWYEQSPRVKFMILIFMMRCQKPLKLRIGPFSVMSLDSLIAILKATYSYIMLMYGVN